jgi:hypothetical protein
MAEALALSVGSCIQILIVSAPERGRRPRQGNEAFGKPVDPVPNASICLQAR